VLNRPKKVKAVVDESFAEMIEQLLPEGWSIHHASFGDYVLLICPHGYTIEQNGTCPEAARARYGRQNRYDRANTPVFPLSQIAA
jgi:hypothetical protein